MSKKRNLIILAEISVEDSDKETVDSVLDRIAEYMQYFEGQISIGEIASMAEVYEEEDKDPIQKKVKRYVSDDYWPQWLPERHVVVEVLGGVATVEKDLPDIDVHIHDLDIEEEEFLNHSVNCYYCGKLFDERDSVGETPNDGGSVCQDCYEAGKPTVPET